MTPSPFRHAWSRCPIKKAEDGRFGTPWLSATLIARTRVQEPPTPHAQSCAQPRRQRTETPPDPRVARNQDAAGPLRLIMKQTTPSVTLKPLANQPQQRPWFTLIIGRSQATLLVPL